jgi:hypothetical protein
MSTHGRSGVRRWVLGSVTETVVRHSDPVLVIPAFNVEADDAGDLRCCSMDQSDVVRLIA